MWQEKGDNSREVNDMCQLVTINTHDDTFTLQYLHNAKLRTPDRFFNNMQLKTDPDNINMISVFGRKAVHRIDLNQVKPERLIWRKPKEHLNYERFGKYDFDAAYRHAMGMLTP